MKVSAPAAKYGRMRSANLLGCPDVRPLQERSLFRAAGDDLLEPRGCARWLIDNDHLVDRPAEGARVAADRFTVLVEEGALALELRWGGSGLPPIGVAGHVAQRELLAACPNDDGRVWPLEGEGLADSLLDAVIPAAEARRWLGPHLANDLDRLAEGTDAVGLGRERPAIARRNSRSAFGDPAPSPRMRRPPLITSIVAPILAIKAGVTPGRADPPACQA
ncbi:MAG: hypothetical protein KatS3mg061_1358 [Dehalococcoidia bacterium]|nr:MAG: hypothetical protein KatS3mg061_1358 [Dehalococcoidia bacterium]